MEIFTGIFRNEFAITFLTCALVIVENVFGEIRNVCEARYTHNTESFASNYNKLIKQIYVWSESLFERELISILSTHSYFEDVLQRSF